ncbi:MAG: mannonate dehydratase [Armatimonas sp.]
MISAFRWYGPEDRVPLAWLRQMTPRPLVVTHLPDVLPGDEWTVERLKVLKNQLDAHELSLGPIESVFWTDAMKTARPGRDEHIENFIKTLHNLRMVFPDQDPLVVTYNIMALDWSRTHLAWEHPNGARGLAFDNAAWENLDLSNGLFLPGWGKPISKAEFDALQESYATLGTDGAWDAVGYVLKALVPEAEKLNIRLAAHPNDPPWSTLGLPALLTDAAAIRRLLALAPSPSNGLCFCTGSYGALPENDVNAMLHEFKESVVWCHLRVTKTTNTKQFHEADHAVTDGDIDLFEVLRTLKDIGFTGIFRSDHGLDLLHETELEMRGYPAIDRYVANKMIWAYSKGLREG